jgi:hypothetical protein
MVKPANTGMMPAPAHSVRTVSLRVRVPLPSLAKTPLRPVQIKSDSLFLIDGIELQACIPPER